MSEEYDEEIDALRYEEEDVFPGNLFYSFYYYSHQVLLQILLFAKIMKSF